MVVEELCIEGANYELTESQIMAWIELYGTVLSTIEEEAIVLMDNKTGEEILAGTGVYLVSAKMNKLPTKTIPNVLPMHGKLVKVFYPGVKYQCRECFDCHKKEFHCSKTPFDKFN